MGMRSNEQNDIKHRRHQRARPTIGLLTGGLQNEVALLEWSGVVDAARKHDVNLICFPGEALRDPNGFRKHANALYDLVSQEILDGLLVWTAMLDWFVTREEMEAFIRRFHPLPVVSAETAFKRIPSVLMDDYQGMRESVVHLIEEHGYRRIAFIRGPDGHIGVQERYQAYVDSLEEYGIPYDPLLVTLPCTWNAEHAKTLIHQMIDEHKTTFEAIVAPSESLSLGALAALQERKISVPRDVAVVGFDDTVEMSAATPPITTTRSPLYEIGSQAVSLLVEMIAGKEVPEQVVIPTKLIVRQSCGCMDPAVVQAMAGGVRIREAIPEETFEVILAAHRTQILTEMVQAAETELASEWIEKMLDSFVAGLKTDPTKASQGFLSLLDEVLRQEVLIRGDVAVWHNVISVMRQQVLPYLYDKDLLIQAENLWQQARLVIGQTIQRMQLFQVLQSERQAQRLRELGQTLITTFNLDELTDILADGLPRLGIPSCYLSLYEDPAKPATWARLILAYNEHGRIDLETKGLRFSALRLVPDGMLDRDRPYRLLVEPLYFREDQIGFAVFEIGPLNRVVYEALRGQISSALKGDLLLAALRDAQEEIVRLEKDALEMQMAGGFGHEMCNALAGAQIMLTSVIEGEKTVCQENSETLVNMFDRIQPYIPDKCWDDVVDAFKEIDHNEKTLDKVIKTVSSNIRDAMEITTLILDYARLGHTTPGNEEVDLQHVIESIVQQHQQAFGEKQISIQVDISTASPLIGHRSHFHSIIHNLVLNARDELIRVNDARKRCITIRLQQEKQTIVISVTDNANGILDEHLPQIFYPFFSTKPRTGTGLGLNFVSKLVTLYQGTIEVDTKVGKGTTFTLTFPMTNS